MSIIWGGILKNHIIQSIQGSSIRILQRTIHRFKYSCSSYHFHQILEILVSSNFQSDPDSEPNMSAPALASHNVFWVYLYGHLNLLFMQNWVSVAWNVLCMFACIMLTLQTISVSTNVAEYLAVSVFCRT